jgi:hypothetical protein
LWVEGDAAGGEIRWNGMSQELISTWLALGPGEWPPNHYRLLGLKLGENDANLIEERVHQRLDMVRRYQMMYPDQATEAMNLLAQAFVCLTDPAAKKVYDHDLHLNGDTGTQPSTAPAAEIVDPNEPVVVLYNPADAGAPPVQVHFSGSSPPPVRKSMAETTPPPPVAQIVETAEVPPAAIPVDAAVPAGPHVPPAPATRHTARRALYRNMVRTRRLLGHWRQLGLYLSSPKRRLTRPAEAVDFLRQLEGIRQLTAELPPLLGQAGQAGYHVLTLVQLNSVPTFQTLTLEQREVLSRDWNDGQLALEKHSAVLRTNLKQSRRQGTLLSLGRASVRLVKNHPGVVLVVLATVSLLVVIFRTLVFDWFPRRH